MVPETSLKPHAKGGGGGRKGSVEGRNTISMEKR